MLCRCGREGGRWDEGPEIPPALASFEFFRVNNEGIERNGICSPDRPGTDNRRQIYTLRILIALCV